MKTPLYQLNQLAQQRIIESPEYKFTESENDRQKIFICTVTLNGCPDFSVTSTGKNKAKRKAANLLFQHLKETIDLTKKPSQNQSDSNNDEYSGDDKNPISTLIELYQADVISPATYVFSCKVGIPHNEYTCICTVDTFQTQGVNVNKQQAKKLAGMKMLEVLEENDALTIPEKKLSAIRPKTINTTSQNAISWLMEAKQIQKITTLHYEYKVSAGNQYVCTCRSERYIACQKSFVPLAYSDI